MTTLQLIILGAVFGFIMNPVRGGALTKYRIKIEQLVGIKHTADGNIIRPLRWYQWIVNRLIDGDVLNALAFFFLVALVPSYVQPGGRIGFEFWADGEWNRAAWAALGMFVGAAMSWGEWIGALGGWNKTDFSSWEPIDELIEKYTDRPKLWGFIGLTLRGAVWGALIGMALNSVWPLLGGITMGLCYALGLKVGGPSKGWIISEAIFGAVFLAFIVHGI